MSKQRPAHNKLVSIPQAVGTIAIMEAHLIAGDYTEITGRFNTASGRYYCNLLILDWQWMIISVSIPQAVGTIAICFFLSERLRFRVSIPQAVGTIAIQMANVSPFWI